MSLMDAEVKNIITVYGPPGVGKTTIAARLIPEGSEAILVAGDNGWQSLRNFPQLAEKIDGPREFEDFSTIQIAARDAIKSNKALIIDGFSSIVQAMMYFYMSPKLPNGAPNPHFFEPKKSPREHPDIPSWDDYHLTKRKWGTVIHALSKLPMNTIITCHHSLPSVQPSQEKMFGDTTRPDLPKEVLALLLKYTSVLGYMERSSSGDRSIKVQPTRRLTAKSWIKFPSDEVSDSVFVETVNNDRKGKINV